MPLPLLNLDRIVSKPLTWGRRADPEDVHLALWHPPQKLVPLVAEDPDACSSHIYAASSKSRPGG